MPAVKTEVVLWGDDPALARWLADHAVRTRPFASVAPARRELILASSKPAAPDSAAAFGELAHRIASGSSVVFLSPKVFAKDEQRTAWLPLAHKGTLTPIRGWLYLKDEWSKRHPIFEGLPSGGLMDYTYYREIIPDDVWIGQDLPDEAVAGAIQASVDYKSGPDGGRLPPGRGPLRAQHAANPRKPGHPSGRRAAAAQHVALRRTGRGEAGS